MQIKNAELDIVIGPTSKLPASSFPEFAFAGRSNVGKSSLINSLLNRKKLARTSSQPGKTQTINFYKVNQELYFVDLPGYGFAKVSKEEQAKWGVMINRYLQESEQLKAVFLLVDIRHEVKSSDKEMFNWMVQNGYQPYIIATKADKIKRSQLQKQVKLLREGFAYSEGKLTVVPYSALSGQGREELLNIIQGLLHEELPE